VNAATDSEGSLCSNARVEYRLLRLMGLLRYGKALPYHV
jgi:hypothetical protein